MEKVLVNIVLLLFFIYSYQRTRHGLHILQLENYYNMLLNIDADGKLAYDFVGDKSSGIVIQSVSGIKCTYGVKYNSNGELEFVLLNENGNEYYINKNEKAEDLYQIINSIFQT